MKPYNVHRHQHRTQIADCKNMDSGKAPGKTEHMSYVTIFLLKHTPWSTSVWMDTTPEDAKLLKDTPFSTINTIVAIQYPQSAIETAPISKTTKQKASSKRNALDKWPKKQYLELSLLWMIWLNLITSLTSTSFWKSTARAASTMDSNTCLLPF